MPEFLEYNFLYSENSSDIDLDEDQLTNLQFINQDVIISSDAPYQVSFSCLEGKNISVAYFLFLKNHTPKSWSDIHELIVLPTFNLPGQKIELASGYSVDDGVVNPELFTFSPNQCVGFVLIKDVWNKNEKQIEIQKECSISDLNTHTFAVAQNGINTVVSAGDLKFVIEKIQKVPIDMEVGYKKVYSNNEDGTISECVATLYTRNNGQVRTNPTNEEKKLTDNVFVEFLLVVPNTKPKWNSTKSPKVATLVKMAHSGMDANFQYIQNQWVYEKMTDDPDLYFSKGIHFWTTFERAKNFHFL